MKPPPPGRGIMDGGTKGSGGGGPNPVPCASDAECMARLEFVAGMLAAPQTTWVQRRLVGSECLAARAPEAGCGERPFCACVFEQDTQEETASPRVLALGADPECDLYGRDGQCLWPSGELAACSVDDPQVCAAPCAEAAARWAADDARTLDVEPRLARCDRPICMSVLRVQGACYPSAAFQGGPGYDCALDDEQILQNAFPNPSALDAAPVCGQGCIGAGSQQAPACAIGVCDTTLHAEGACLGDERVQDLAARPDAGEPSP